MSELLIDRNVGSSRKRRLTGNRMGGAISRVSLNSRSIVDEEPLFSKGYWKCASGCKPSVRTCKDPRECPSCTSSYTLDPAHNDGSIGVQGENSRFQTSSFEGIDASKLEILARAISDHQSWSRNRSDRFQPRMEGLVGDPDEKSAFNHSDRHRRGSQLDRYCSFYGWGKAEEIVARRSKVGGTKSMSLRNVGPYRMARAAPSRITSRRLSERRLKQV